MQGNGRLEADQGTGRARVGQPSWHRIDRSFRLMHGMQARLAHQLGQHDGKIAQAGFAAAADIERYVRGCRLGGQYVGPGDIAAVHHVHRLMPVAEDDRRLPRLDAFHPPYQHLGIAPVDIHSRTVHIEVAETDAIESVHLGEHPRQTLAEQLCHAIERAVAVGVVIFRRRKGFGQTVNRGRGGHHHLAHPERNTGLEQVESRVDHHLHRAARFRGTLRDAQRRHVKHGVGAGEQLAHQRAVANVSLAQNDRTARPCAVEIFRPTAHHVVYRNDFPAAAVDETIDGVRADEPGTPRHYHLAVAQDQLRHRQILSPISARTPPSGRSS